ncbi:MAG: GNAT family N-acetyltransferase [Desulfococcaceae bacterium]
MTEIQFGYVPGVIGRVAELHGRYYSESWGFGVFFESRVARELAQFLSRFDPDRDGFWTVQHYGRIEGAIAIDGVDAETEGAHLRWFILSDNLRGTGWGRKLLDRAIDFCVERGYNRIYLNTFQGLHAARALYEQAGFRLVEQREGERWGSSVNEQRFELETPAMVRSRMETIYGERPPEQIPWNQDNPPALLKERVENGDVSPCRAVDLGCGAGNAAIYLAGRGFDVLGVDFSERAVALARETADRRGVSCEFRVADVLGDLSEVPETFDFAYDWELLHHIFPPDREVYVRNVHRLLKPGGNYLTASFGEASPAFGGKGKYRRTPLNTTLYFSSEKEILELFAPFFHIRELRTAEIEGKTGNHIAVYGFMEARDGV